MPNPVPPKSSQVPRSPVEQRDIVVPLAIGGMYSAGDPSMIPDGQVVMLSNCLVRPGRFDSRPPAVYDSLMGVTGLLTWEDLANQVTRFLALDSTKLYMKNTSGEAWNAGTAALLTAGQRLTDFVSYRGKLYFMMDDGAGNPVSAWVWDGTTLSGTPFNSTITSRAIAVLDDRLFFAYPRVTTTVPGQSPLTYSYDWSDLSWPKTNLTVTNLVSGTTTVCRLFPTSTAAQACSIKYNKVSLTLGLVNVAASTLDQPYTWRLDVRNQDPLIPMPITMELLFVNKWNPSIPYGVGQMIASGGFRHRVTTAGTSGGSLPAFTTTLGGTTADNTVTWTNEGSEVIGSLETFVPPLNTALQTNKDGFTTLSLLASVPWVTVGGSITPRLKFYNTAQPALTVLSPLDISLKDGIADGNPAKRNYGSQITAGSFRYPFFNQESSATATVNLESIIWSEPADPQNIRGANTYEPKEIAGLPTASRVVSGRYLVFKRRGFWSFVGTGDPNVPIQTEGPASVGAGCLGPRALDVMDDEVFFIGEDEVYRMRIGSPPVVLCGHGMREEIMNKNAATWVESQSTYNMPFLVCDKKNREVWVYTQKGKLYVYHLNDEDVPAGYRALVKETGMWSVHNINNAEVRSMALNPVTEELEIAFGGFGLSRLDPTATPQQDQIDNTASFFPVSKDVIFKPLELFAPRYDALLDWIALYHLATASQSGQTLTVSCSFDRGATYPKTDAVTVPLTTPRIPMTLRQRAASLTIKISHLGNAGAAAWSISKAEAMLRIKRGEYPAANPVQGAATL